MVIDYSAAQMQAPFGPMLLKVNATLNYFEFSWTISCQKAFNCWHSYFQRLMLLLVTLTMSLLLTLSYLFF